MIDYNLVDRVIFIIDFNLIDIEILMIDFNLMVNVIFVNQIIMIAILQIA